MSKVFETQFNKWSMIDKVSWDELINSNIELKKTKKWLSCFSTWTNEYITASFDISDTDDISIECAFMSLWNNSIAMIFDNNSSPSLEWTDSTWYKLYFWWTSSINTWPISIWKRYHFIWTFNKSTWVRNLYLNNILIATETDNTWSTISSISFFARGSWTYPFNWYISQLKFYDHVITSEEISKLYNKFLQLRPLTLAKTVHYQPATKLKNNWLITAYNMHKIWWKIYDISENWNTWIVYWCLQNKDWLLFNWTSDYVWMPSIRSYLTDSFSVNFALKIYWTPSIDVIIQQWATANWTWWFYLRIDSLTSIRLTVWNWITRNTTVFNISSLDQKKLIIFTVTWSLTEKKLYINSVLVWTVSYTLSWSFNTWTAVATPNIWSWQATSDYLWWELQWLQIYNKILSQQEIEDYYNTFLEKIEYINDFRYEKADWVARLPEDFTKWTWTYKIVDVDSADILPIHNWLSKMLECATAWTIWMKVDRSYWTTIFAFNKVNSSTSMHIYFAWTTMWANWWYKLSISTRWQLKLVKLSTALFSTSVWYIDLDTIYMIKIVRTQAGIFTLYISWWSFWDRTLITTTSWSNPVTDTTYTTANYFRQTVWVWDQIWMLRKQRSN